MLRSLVLIATVFALNGSAESPMPSLPPLPDAVSSFGATLVGNHLYVYGGHVGKTHSYHRDSVSAKFRRLNLENLSQGWIELPSSEGVQGTALVRHQQRIIRVGGMSPRNSKGEAADNFSVATVESWEDGAKAWRRLPDLPTARSSHDATVMGDTLYVFGGWELRGKDEEPKWFDHGLSLDLSNPTARWERIPQPFARRALTVIADESRCYLVGGLNDEGGTTCEVATYEPRAKQWATLPALPTTKMNGFSPAAVVVNGRLLVSPADGHLYELREGRWQSLGQLLHPRYVHRVLAHQSSSLVIVGGASKTGNVSQLERFLLHSR